MSSPSFRKLSVVVACFNEEANLKRFPNELLPILQENSLDYEIVLVDDGSSDGTWETMKNFKGAIAARHPENRGLGAALRTGFAHSSGDAILTLDADLTFHPREIPSLLQAFTPETDCVMGSPLRGKMEGVSLYRQILSGGVNSIYRFLLSADVTSVSSIFRLYRAARIKSLELTCHSFDINAEILFRILAAGGIVKEVPATLGTRIHGESKINTLREIKNHLKMFTRILQWKTLSQK